MQNKTETRFHFISNIGRKYLRPFLFSSSIKHDEATEEEDLLEMVFAACNRGSRREDARFENCGVPSLSSGDVVVLESKGKESRCFMCMPSGWKLLNEDECDDFKGLLDPQEHGEASNAAPID